MCETCHYSCLTCSAFTTCTSCNTMAYRFFNLSSCPPVPGYYDNSTTIAVLCTVVDANCQSCINSTTFTCLYCDSGYYLTTTGVCVVCPIDCSNCTSATVCTACITGYIINPTT